MARGRKNIIETEIGNTGLSLQNVSGKVAEDLSKLWKGKNKKDFIIVFMTIKTLDGLPVFIDSN